MKLTDKPARLIVCGGRDFHDYDRLASVMDRLQAIRPISMVFHGNARGADLLADRWCRERGVRVHPVPAEWSKHGRAAGPKRNQAMLGHGIDLVVAFPGGRGTEDMVKRAHKAGVLVTRAVAAPGLRPPPQEPTPEVASARMRESSPLQVEGAGSRESIKSDPQPPSRDGKEKS